MAESAPSTHQLAAEAFAQRVGERFEGAVETVLLYGSVARGEERGVASDVDLLVVLCDDVDHEAYERRIRELAYDVELEHGVVLSLVVTTAAEYTREPNRPFFQQIQRDAETLYGRGIGRGRRTRAGAGRISRRAGSPRGGGVGSRGPESTVLRRFSRRAGGAVRSWREPRLTRARPTGFGQHIVLEGGATREQGRLLGTLYDYRREADYGHGPPAADLEALITEVESFVEEMHDLVEDVDPDH